MKVLARTGVRRPVMLLLGIVVVVGIMGGLFVSFLLAMASRTSDNADGLRIANATIEALSQQVESLGGEPVAGPSSENGTPTTGQGGVVTVTGPEGPAGRPGDPGLPGSPGSPGSPGPQGESGSVGSQGERGPEGPVGPAGEAGAVGPQGPVGAEGPQGPAPASFTFSFEGINFVCTDPDGDGNYQCAFG